MALFRTTICRLLNIYLTQKERVQFKIETEATHTSFSFKIKQDKKLCQSIKYDQKLIYDSLKKKTATLKLHTAKPFFTVTRGILTKLVSACFFFPVKNVFFFFRTKEARCWKPLRPKRGIFRPICSIIYFAGSLTLRCQLQLVSYPGLPLQDLGTRLSFSLETAKTDLMLRMLRMLPIGE